MMKKAAEELDCHYQGPWPGHSHFHMMTCRKTGTTIIARDPTEAKQKVESARAEFKKHHNKEHMNQ